jgi:hypothetical protein
MKGALIFAFNNDQIDYVALAEWTAANVRRHLGIPVAVVTDHPTDRNFDRVVVCESTGTNSRYFSDYATNVVWHNESRADAYSLSPWDETLVLDADYVVATDQLQSIMSADQDFLSHQTAYDVTGVNDFRGLNAFGKHNMPMSWATVMKFRRSTHARLIFDSMAMVRNNWKHYRDLHQNTHHTYRNDHALSIALAVTNGHALNTATIPWSLASLTPDHKLTQIDTDRYRVDFVNSTGQRRWITLAQDFHAMGKQQLGEIVANCNS